MDPEPSKQRTNESSSDRIDPGSDIRNYVENRIELFSITVAEQIAMTLSASIQKFIGLLFLSFGAVFLWIALGFYLGELLNSQALGFFLAALPLLFIGIVFYKRSSKTVEQKIHTDIVEKIAVNFDQKTPSLAENDSDMKKRKKGEKL
jgi:uncharacterized membrane protein YqjE